ncbi:MAG TPA: ankyrin repeat domain-containing protein [Fibrobacteria bacterium]|nr:ankyrin repeat domain-containing protein [Fibrobacteria bacterium]
MKNSLFPMALIGLTLGGCASAPNQGRKNFELIRASRQGDVGRVSSLITDGADINAVDEEGWTPYLAASAEGNWKVMKLLQEKGCKTDPGF